MRGYITLKRLTIFGATLRIHWSAILAAGILFGTMIREPVHAMLAVGAYASVILLHEAGHAFVAKKLGYPPSNIYLTFIHGLCEFEEPYTLKEHAMIAWGGVLAQLAVALPLMALGHLTSLGSMSPSALLISILGYFSLLIALINLAPARGLDGSIAWQIIPILARDLRYWFGSKRTTKAVLRRLK
ncbi:MAG TPA: hypothetical protein VF522_02410 [Ramlibacter sp.]|uniref:hypothetical protein n=1 Tax=Ramlibacter sp. TaxID=1917967 RepID=UPI002ED14E84